MVLTWAKFGGTPWRLLFPEMLSVLKLFEFPISGGRAWRSLSISSYIITQVILAFWLVLAYDLLEDRRIDDNSTRFKFFLIWTNHNSLLSIATNQFPSFYIDIRSRQCYFHVCQSGEIWNKKAFLLYILIFFLYKTKRFHVAMHLFSNRSQRMSKCGKNISDTLGCASCATFLFYNFVKLLVNRCLLD